MSPISPWYSLVMIPIKILFFSFNNLCNVASKEWESDLEYELSSVSTNDHVLDSNIKQTNPDEDDDSVEGDYLMQLRCYHWDAFYM